MGNNYNKFEKRYLTELSIHIESFDSDTCVYLPQYRRAVWGLLNIFHCISYGTLQPTLTHYANIIKTRFAGKTEDYLMGILLVSVKLKNYNIKFTQKEYDTLLQDYLVSCKTTEYKEYWWWLNCVED